jgi:hypothetical protein
MAQPGILSSQIPPGEDHVMRALADIRREMRELGPSIMHSFQGIVDELAAHQATLDAQQATLTTTVADLSTAQATLATTVSGLTTAQATLATTVSGLTTAQANIAANLTTLNAAVADINTLVGQQVAGNTGVAFSGTVTATTSWQYFAVVTIPVPAGYSIAKVIGVSSAMCLSAPAFSVRTEIGGVAGNALPAIPGVATSSHARTLTGLSGGNITIASDINVSSGTSTAELTTSAFVIFLR